MSINRLKLYLKSNQQEIIDYWVKALPFVMCELFISPLGMSIF